MSPERKLYQELDVRFGDVYSRKAKIAEVPILILFYIVVCKFLST